MMFIEDTFDVIFTIYLGNQVIEQWRMQAPRPLLKLNSFRQFSKLLLRSSL